MPNGDRVDFFISYTSQDQKYAAWVAEVLRDAGYSVIFQNWDFRPGHDFLQEMQRGLTTSERLIAVLTPAYFRSSACAAEWRAKYNEDMSGEKRLLIPVRFEEVEPQGLLSSRNYVDLVSVDAKEAEERLLEGVSTHPPQRERQPYPGGGPGKPGPVFHLEIDGSSPLAGCDTEIYRIFRSMREKADLTPEDIEISYQGRDPYLEELDRLQQKAEVMELSMEEMAILEQLYHKTEHHRRNIRMVKQRYVFFYKHQLLDAISSIGDKLNCFRRLCILQPAPMKGHASKTLEVYLDNQQRFICQVPTALFEGIDELTMQLMNVPRENDVGA